MRLDEYRLSRRILKLANLDLKRRNAHLKVLDLTYEQSDTLQFVYFHPDCSITDLKEFLGVSHQTAQGITARMEKKGLLERMRSSQDGRMSLLRLSELGTSRVLQILNNGQITGSVIQQGMSEEEQQEFVRLIDLAIQNLQNDM